MTKDEIAENNKLIAEFMGRANTPPEWMRYHKDWNWIMPVVQKIASGIYPNKKGGMGAWSDIDLMLGECGKSIESLSVFDDIETWFKGVADFCWLYEKVKNKIQKS